MKNQAGQLYTTTLIVRTIILITLASFYFAYQDPLMIILFLIVGVGFVVTLTSYIRDRKAEV